MLLDATQVAPYTGEYEPIPNNEYLLQVVEGEVRKNAEEGKLGVLLKFQVAAGEYEGKTFTQYYNLQNPNATAQKIGQGEFSALCHAVRVLQPRDPSEFVARPFLGKVVVTPPSKGKDGKDYGAGNEIKKYRAADGSAPVVGTIAPAPAAPKKAAPSWVTGAKAS